MSRIIRFALSGAIKTLIGSDWWDKVRKVTADLSNEDLTGEEKRAMAISFIKESGWDLASFLLNLAIEIAVALLAAESKKLDA